MGRRQDQDDWVLDLAGPAGGGPIAMWVKGVLLPVGVLSLAMWLSTREEFEIPGSEHEWVVRGLAATWAVGALGWVALFLHFHYFWELKGHPWISRSGKGACALGFIVSVLMTVVYSMAQ